MGNIATVVITDVFVIEHGSKLDLNKMEIVDRPDAGVLFVGRSGEGNGIAATVLEIPGLEPYPAGAITVALGGSTLASFVQPRRFYTAQNIDVLIPKAKMTLDEKLYYCLCIEANRFRYSTFGREANRTLKHLQVPSRSSVPSWVKGATVKSVKDLSRDLLAVVREDA
jgi:hypothetical protein